MNKIKTIFFGSGDFAVPILNKLINLDFIELVLIVTQPDKPVGRKKVLTPTPIGKEIEINEKLKRINVLKPEKLKLISEEILEKHKPELIIVASYGQMIPPNIVHYPRFGVLNFHGSILPALRGAVPVQMAILNGLEETGVTMQLMDEGLDNGDIIAIRKYSIKEDETSETLMNQLAELSSRLMEENLQKWVNGEIKAKNQDESSATYCYKSDISKEKAEITPLTSIDKAEKITRAFYPWPVAWIRINQDKTEKILKIYKAKVIKEIDFKEFEKFENLDIVRNGKKLYLKLNDGVIELLEIQLEGKSRDISHNYLYIANSSL